MNTDIQIDERSLSEDEREAQSALHPNELAFNVLDQHHRQNRPNHLPTTARLATAALQQNGLNANPEKTNGGDLEPEDDASDQQYSDPEGHIYLRGPRCPRSRPRQRLSTTLGFYPGSWKTVLIRAKNRFARHVFLNQGFPVRSSDLGIARDILYEEIAKGKAEKLTLDLCKPNDYSIKYLLI